MTEQEHLTHRGAISQHVQALPASGIRRFFDLIANTKDIISLGVGEPDFVTPPNISSAAVKSIEEGFTHYTSNYGLPELRQAISTHIHKRYGIEYDPATEIIITTGVSEAINLAMLAIVDRGDEVIATRRKHIRQIIDFILFNYDA